MTKRYLLRALAIMAVCAGFMTSAYAEEKTVNGRFGWQQDATGTWWKMTGGSGYLSDGWYWIDGNNDGKVQCYYFDQNGYLVTNGTTPDGYIVNEDGAWVDGGAVQTKDFSTYLGHYRAEHDTGLLNTDGTQPVTDPNSIAKIQVKPEIAALLGQATPESLGCAGNTTHDGLSSYSSRTNY